MKQIPMMSYDLILALDEAYPEQSPDPATPERKLWMEAGRRELIRNLKHRMEAQPPETMVGWSEGVIRNV